MKWLAFSYSLPAKSGSAPRVALWRRLRRLGAVSPTGSVQVLPDNPECAEAFQWLAQEMRQAGGEAVVMRVEQFSGLSDQQVIEVFQAARAEEYAELEPQVGELEDAARTVGSDGLADLQEMLARLRRRHADISRVDYFRSPQWAELAARLAQIGQALATGLAQPVSVPAVKRADYKNRRWVTRPHPHVDRLACIWLIRRFIDPAAVVRYAERPAAGEVSFDMENDEFGHRGNFCTFETVLRAFGFEDAALSALAQIVHEIDLRDGLYARPEVPGLDAILGGWLAAGLPDADLEAHGLAVYEGLYTSLTGSVATS